MSSRPASQGVYAGPVVRGFWPNIKRNWSDLFKWRIRVQVTDGNGVATHTEWRPLDRWTNPFRLLALMSWTAWLHFVIGFLCWCADAFDFHALTVQQVKLAKYYGETKTRISLAITLTLLLRSVGACIFGLLGDGFGRKWPMVFNMVILGLLQIATIFCPTYSSFIAVRAIFGLFMGGVYGNAIAMALENAPAEVRGLLSGILQQGYSFAYVLVACCNLIVGGRTDSWRETFWVGAAFSIGVGVLRIFFGESRQFLEAKALAKVQSQENQNKQPQSGWRIFWHNFCAMMRAEWGLVLYCVLMMTAFNSYSHTSQDNYTTFMLTQKELGNAGASRASILMKTGACVGGTIMGYASQFVGRRRAAVFAAVASLFMIPAWIIPNTEAGLSAGAFFMQFFVQGAWSVVPVHLNELSPPAFRSSFPGVTYQVGNMLSAPAAQIVNALAESHYVRNPSGHKVEAYGPVMAIVTTIVAIIIVITLGSGPERTGRHFEEALPAAVETELGTLSHHHQPATK